MPVAHSRYIWKYSALLDFFIFIQVVLMLILPFSTTLFFIFSPNSSAHPRHIIPDGYAFKDSFIFGLMSVLFATWSACACWYAIMVYVVLGTIYIGNMLYILVIKLMVKNIQIKIHIFHLILSINDANYAGIKNKCGSSPCNSSTAKSVESQHGICNTAALS